MDNNSVTPPPQSPVLNTLHHGTPILRIIALLIFAILIAALSTVGAYLFFINQNQIISSHPTLQKMMQPTSGNESEKALTKPFCKEYGTYQIQKNDLLKTYTVGPGETSRDVAKKTLGDEKKVASLIETNPSLTGYQVDSVLPFGMKLYLPNNKYNAEGVIIYLKAKGNITYNKTQPYFGIGAPNSGTGPFTITDNLKGSLAQITDGECVSVIYGSRGSDPEKVVFEVKTQ